MLRSLGRESYCQLVVLMFILLSARHASAEEGWRIDGELRLAEQAYESGTLSESMYAGHLDVHASSDASRKRYGYLALGWREDLYQLASHATLGGLARGDTWNLSTELRLERSAAGRLNDFSTFFDPDSELSSGSDDYASDRLGLRLGCDRRLGTAQLRLDCSLSRQSYDEPDEFASDQAESDLDLGATFYIWAEVQVECEFSLCMSAYEQRPESDGEERELTCKFFRNLGADWEFFGSLGLRGRSVSDIALIPDYERPNGSLFVFAAGCDYFPALDRSFTVELSQVREDWDYYDGYYHDGRETELAFMATLPCAGDSRLELFCELSFFEPDSLSDSDWMLRRNREQRLETGGHLSWRDESRLQLGAGVFVEQISVGDDECDRFTLAQCEGDAVWRAGAGWRCECSCALDRYVSKYAAEDEEKEWGYDLEFSLRRLVGRCEIGLFYSDGQRFSFLAGESEIREREVGVDIRWNP